MKGLRQLVLVLLLLVLSSSMAVAQAPYSTTNVIMVNGIMVPNATTWSNTVTAIGKNFVAAHVSLSATVKFSPQYNKSNGLFPDLMQSAAYAANVPDMGPFLDDFNNITSPNQGISGLIGSGVFLSNYLEERFSNRLKVTAALQPQDFKDLVAAAKVSLANKQRVVFLAHSQGNYYANYAYQQLVSDTAFQKSVGINLPNLNLLSVVSIANPASWSADGRYAYVTHCNDIINLVPQHLPSNIGGTINCQVQDVLSGPITPAKVGELIPLANIWTQYPDWSSRWSYMVLHPLNAVWAGLKLADLNNWKYVGRLLYSAEQHMLDGNLLPVGLPLSSYYMYPGSDTQKRVYQLLEDSLPDLLCDSAIDCFMKDDFRSASLEPKWQQVRLQGPNSSIKQQNGTLVLTTAGYFVGGGAPSTSNYAPGFATLRTRKVFANRFSLDAVINHIGGGRSKLALRRVKNDDLVWSFTVDTSRDYIECYPQFNGLVFLPTASQFGGRRNLRVTGAGNKLALYINNIEWNSASITPGEGYYFEVSSEDDNIFLVHSFVVTESPLSTAPPPPGNGFSITKLSCNPNPTTTQQATNCKLTGTNFKSGNQFAVFGGNCSASTGCRIIPDTSTYSATNIDFNQSLTVSGTYTVKGRYSSTDSWIAAPESITVNAVVSGTAAVAVSGYSGTVNCNLNGASISAPLNPTARPAGDYTLSCTAPTGYTITSVTPSATQSLGANGPILFTLHVSPTLLPPSCSANPTTIVPGGSTVLTGSYSGGKAPILTSWSGAVTGNGLSATYTSNAQTPVGSYSATFRVVDSSTPQQIRTVNCGFQVQNLADFMFTAFSQNASVQAGGQVAYGLNLTPQNGFNSAVTVFVSGLRAGVSIVNPSLVFQVGSGVTTSFNFTLQTTGGTPPGNYVLALQAQGGGITKYLNLQLNVTAPPPGPLGIVCYFSPGSIPLGSLSTLFCNGSGGRLPYQYCFNGGQCQSSASTVVQPTSVGAVYYAASIKDATNTVVSTTVSLTVNGVAPTVTGTVWDAQPRANTNFSGYVSGTGFVPGATVWLYGPGCSNGCQHPGAGVSVLSLTQIRVVNLRLASGSFQVEVRTPYGSGRSSSFSVN